PVPPGFDLRRQSARVLAAIAIADKLPDQGNAILKAAVENWWRKESVPALNSGKIAWPREQTYAFFEMAHALQDNLRIDLRESAGGYFRQFTVDHLAGHYPAPFPAAENQYRVPVFVREGEPNLDEAALARAAELAM